MIVSLQYLRGIAAMMVVAFHAFDVLARMGTGGHDEQFMVGLAGVDIFFVISGFIMWIMAEKAYPSPAEFVRKRLIRIVPLYWALTLFLAAVALVKPDLLSTAVFDPAHFVASMLFIPWPHPKLEAAVPLLIPGWTLNYEMAFYLIFALCLFLPKRWRLISLLGALSLLAAAGPFVPQGGAAAFYTDTLVLEFAAGALLAWLWLRGVTLSTAMSLTLVVAGFALLYLGAGSTLPRIVSLGLPAAMIVGGSVFAENLLRRQPFQPLLMIGDASYSIYLSHGIGLAVLTKLWTAAGLGGDGWQAFAFVAVTLSAAAIGGILLYLSIEKPMLAWMNARTGQRRTTAARLAAATNAPGQRRSHA
ncbi:acyltransferase [Mesorhizobium sp. LHD-90]|uniref:acyltransferase family protein n=1 Tax=Mesorhizobium sp. LHD-90 TaxID=3071414 RepID=UPI0027E210A4|nr:acyltransferase [Mesorhizobium sp. LHD-90]MDQ6434589.1 acyltransferase [Mesorhizobium sp. LHD-90]